MGNLPPAGSKLTFGKVESKYGLLLVASAIVVVLVVRAVAIVVVCRRSRKVTLAFLNGESENKSHQHTMQLSTYTPFLLQAQRNTFWTLPGPSSNTYNAGWVVGVVD